MLKGRGSLPTIPVHDERRALATKKKFGSIGWHTFRHTYSSLLKTIKVQMEVQVEIVFDRKSSSGDWSPKAEMGALGAPGKLIGLNLGYVRVARRSRRGSL